MTKLRIISGELKGRYAVISDAVNFRPTQERIRESVAEIIKRRIPGAAAADLCAGSGAVGFEILSRGAASVDFVEIDKSATIKIADNARAFRVAGRIKVIREDVRKFVEERHRKIDESGEGGDVGKYDIIFYDPPYDDAELNGFVPEILPLLNDDGLLIYERRRRQGEKKPVADGLNGMTDARLFSDTVVEFYSVTDSSQP